MTRLAPLMHELAVRGAPVDRDDPVAVAYALRDAADLVRPALLIADGSGERQAEALLDPGADLAATGLVECVRVLAALGLDTPIGVRLVGPWTLSGSAGAAAQADSSREDLCEDLGDRLAAAVDPLAEAGASVVVVWEREWDGGEAVAAAHGTIARRLSFAGLEGVLRRPGEPDSGPYGQVVVPAGPGLIEAEAFSSPSRLREELARVEAVDWSGFTFTDGPIPAATPNETLLLLAPSRDAEEARS